MMAAKLIILEAWAAATYGESSPHINTLRRWARDALIVPAPEKHGRTYYVSPAARYCDYRSPGRCPGRQTESRHRPPGRSNRPLRTWAVAALL